MAKRSTKNYGARYTTLPEGSHRDNWNGSKWIRPEKRLALYSRDGFCCVYCGRGAEDGVTLTLDHVLAVELGGGNEATNLVTCCLACNSAKQDKTVKAWVAYLRVQGVNTKCLAKRIRAACDREVNITEGKRLLALRKSAKARKK